MNHAQEFKLAFEKEDIPKMVMTLEDWRDANPHDANFTLAALILMFMHDAISFKKCCRMIQTADFQEPADALLYDWYKDTIVRLMENSIIDSIHENPALAKKFANSQTADNVSDNDKMFAQHFLWLLDKASEGDGYLGRSKIDDLMDNLLEEWVFRFPDDANLTCAYVIAKVDYLNNDKIERLISRANNQEAIDKDSYPKLLSIMIEKSTKKVRGCLNQR